MVLSVLLIVLLTLSIATSNEVPANSRQLLLLGILIRHIESLMYVKYIPSFVEHFYSVWYNPKEMSNSIESLVAELKVLSEYWRTDIIIAFCIKLITVD